ncbi:MAG: acyl-CoA desaturase [Bacteroidetes bacterium]|nr:acyl-CoA desaturase [Bacteroidota bacterium]
MAKKITFAGKDKSEFFSTVKKRVDAYFEEKGISQYANGFMIFKTIFVLSILFGSYFLLIFNLYSILGQYSLAAMFLLWILIGFFTAFAGVNIGHDAVHGAYSSNKTVNTVLGYIFNIAGANAYMWGILHNIVHHTYTNIQGYDPDINSVPLTRLSPHQKRYKIQRYQHWYAFIFYGFASLGWVFIKDYKNFFTKNVGNYYDKQHPKIEYFILFFFKAVYYTVFLVLPLVLVNQPWQIILAGFFVLHFVEGITLVLTVMLAHMVDDVAFPLPDKHNKIENTWAVHQLFTTADFARNNPLVSFFFGGLNFHIEHHLFPKICHVHHRPLSDIVKQTAREFNLPYYDYPTFGGAIRSHVRFLKKLGRE